MSCTNSATFASNAVASSWYCLGPTRLKARMLVLSCLIATLSTTRAADAQERTVIRGTLVDSLDRPVAEATIRTSPPALSTVTDSSGRFGLSLDRRDRLSLIIAKVGFEPDTVHVNFAARVLVDTVIVINQSAVVLSTVLVESTVPARYRGIARYEDFYLRRRMAVGGTFFDRAQLDRMGSMMRALNTVPGVRATEFNGRVGARFSRCPSGKVAVVIDGLYLPGMGMGDIRSNEVETLEVYTGVAQIPAEARGDACAAVIMTTRMVTSPDVN